MLVILFELIFIREKNIQIHQDKGIWIWRYYSTCKYQKFLIYLILYYLFKIHLVL